MNQTAALLLQYNPWLRDPHRQAELIAARLPSPLIAREPMPELRTDRVLLVIGPRQAGKSTLLLELARRQTRPVVVVSCEEPAIRARCRSAGELLLWLAAEVIDIPALLILEEIQHVDDAGLLLKGLADSHSGHSVAATGSASYQLRARTRESLAGRADRVLLLPLSHAELAHEARSLPLAARHVAGRELWMRQLRYGGYPAAWLSNNPEAELARLAEAFVLRDASDLYQVEHLDAFRTLMRLAALDTGQIVNLASWASEAGIARDTASRYLDLLEESHLVRRVRPFLGGKRAELKSATKVYYLDNGLRNALFGGFGAVADRADGGALAESWVFAEIAKCTGLLDSVRFWRTRGGAEVDFVVDRPTGERFGIEVKLGALNEPRLSRGARAFIEAYRPTRFLLVNDGLSQVVDVDGVPVHFCRPWDLPHLLGS